MKVDIFKIILLTFFIFGIMLDLSFMLIHIEGNGEMLSQVHILDDAHNLVISSGADIQIELLDLLAVFVLPIFCLIIKKRQYDFAACINQTFRLPLSIWALFIIFTGFSLLLNWNYYSQYQLFMMFLHWLKLVEIIVLPIILIPLFGDLDAKSFTRIFLLSFILSSLIMLASYFFFNYKSLVPDRMETSIVLMIGICITFYLYELETNKRKLMRYEEWLYFLAVFLGSLFILQAHKRGAIISLLVLILVVSAICIIKKRSRFLMSAFLISLTISSVTLSGDFHRSIDSEFTGIYKSRFSSVLVIDSLDDSAQEVTTIPDFREFIKKTAIHLDGSGAERLAKYIYSFDILSDYKILGDGYWGAQYRYSFLPDSILQVPIETGYLGFLVCISFFITLFCVVKPYHFSFPYIHLTFLPFFIDCLFCNPVYMFRPMVLLLFFKIYATLKFGENDPSKIVDKSSAQVRR